MPPIVPKISGSLRNSLRLRGLRAKLRQRRPRPAAEKVVSQCQVSHQDEQDGAHDDNNNNNVRGGLPTVSVSVDTRKRSSLVDEMEFEMVEAASCDTSDKYTSCSPDAAGNEDESAYLEFLLFLRTPPALEQERGIRGDSEPLPDLAVVSSEGAKTMPTSRLFLFESYSQLGAAGKNVSCVENRAAAPKRNSTEAVVPERTHASDSSIDSTDTTSVSKTSSNDYFDGAESLPRRKVEVVDNATTQMLSDVKLEVETAVSAGADATSTTSCHAVRKVDSCSNEPVERRSEHDKENALTGFNTPDFGSNTPDFPVASHVMIMSTHRRHGLPSPHCLLLTVSIPPFHSSHLRPDGELFEEVSELMIPRPLAYFLNSSASSSSS